TIIPGPCPIHISQPKIVSNPMNPKTSPADFAVVNFSAKNLTASKLLHTGMEYNKTEDFPAPTKERAYITGKNTTVVCKNPRMAKCFQCLLSGRPALVNNIISNIVIEPVPKRSAEKVKGPIYSSPCFM